jgi:adenylate cyclase
MSETCKLAAILFADVVDYSRLAGADEDRILARLRALRSDLVDSFISACYRRIVKRTGDGSIVEFRSVVDAVRCAIQVRTACSSATPACHPSAASNFASAFTSATRRSRAMAT